MVNKEKIMFYIKEKFPKPLDIVWSLALLENIVDYGIEYENDFRGQLLDFLAKIIPEVTSEEIRKFMERMDYFIGENMEEIKQLKSIRHYYLDLYILLILRVSGDKRHYQKRRCAYHKLAQELRTDAYKCHFGNMETGEELQKALSILKKWSEGCLQKEIISNTE